MLFSNSLRYRSVWLGVAMIWIMIFHLPLQFSIGILEKIRSIGYGGVDICFFASGIGCYYSLTSDSDVGNFIKRRISKLAPCYLVFMFFWLIFKYFCNEFTIQMAIGNIFAVQNFTGLGQEFNWYISALCLFYLLAPYFKIVIDRASPCKRYLFLLFLIAFSIPFWNSYTYIITITRFPIFYLGMLFATMCQQNKRITLKHGVLLGAALIVGVLALGISIKYYNYYLWINGLYWYPFILMTPPICIAISYIMHFIERIKVLKILASVLSLIGDYSFEIYLVHIPLITILNMGISRYNLYHIQAYVWLAGIVVLSICCFLLRRIAKFCVSLWSKFFI